MTFKFEKLDGWLHALEYTDAIYAIAEQLPPDERFGLRSQMTRAVNSIALNIAEGSTSQTDPEQARFVGYALRSVLETVACLHLITRRHWVTDSDMLREPYRQAERLFARLQAFRTALLRGGASGVREDPSDYDHDLPF